MCTLRLAAAERGRHSRRSRQHCRLRRRARAGGLRGSRSPNNDFVHSSPTIDEEKFESLLDQVRELHRIADELTTERVRLHENVRARLSWSHDAPPLPREQRDVADKAVEALSAPRLTAAQSRRLYRAFFGK